MWNELQASLWKQAFRPPLSANNAQLISQRASIIFQDRCPNAYIRMFYLFANYTAVESSMKFTSLVWSFSVLPWTFYLFSIFLWYLLLMYNYAKANGTLRVLSNHTKLKTKQTKKFIYSLGHFLIFIFFEHVGNIFHFFVKFFS